MNSPIMEIAAQERLFTRILSLVVDHDARKLGDSTPNNDLPTDDVESETVTIREERIAIMIYDGGMSENDAITALDQLTE